MGVGIRGTHAQTSVYFHSRENATNLPMVCISSNIILDTILDVTPWHRLAQIFLEKKIDLPEIGKLMIINTAIGLVEREENAKKIGINVIDNSDLYDALVFGLLKRQPTDQPISYTDLAALLNLTARIVGSAVNRLIKQQIIEKDERGRLGSLYTVYSERYELLPLWIIEFTAALIDLHNDPELKARTIEEVKETQFYRGFEVLRKEIREKFYHPRKENQAEG